MFKKAWKGIRSGGCVNNPAYREANLADCLEQLDDGVVILQRDKASGNSRYLDHYCTAGAVGPGIRDERYGATPPVVIEGSELKLHAFLRARPKAPDAAIVIHLVDWNEITSQPATLKLRNSAFFARQRLVADLLTPAVFDPAAHAKAALQAQAMRQPGSPAAPSVQPRQPTLHHS